MNRRHRTGKTIAGLITTAVLAVLGFIAYAAIPGIVDFIEHGTSFPTTQGAQTGQQPAELPQDGAPVALQLTGDYYSVVGTAVREHEITTGSISYCPLDELGRTTCAYGELTSSLRAEASGRDRQELLVDPSGWNGNNLEVTIPRVDVIGSQDYTGWFWNRSHLIADSLGGDAVIENLVTGTRTQNVGSTQVNGQYAGGMAFTEGIARAYLDTGTGDSCPLYYAATPRYESLELIPHSVTVDIQSCDQSIDMRVEVLNAANGYAIDYVTGEYSSTAS